MEDDDHKPFDFNGETISFTCPLVNKSFIILNELGQGST